MCRVFGVDYKFASDNIDKILKALGENYYTRNTDVLSRLQGKDIIIEKR
ncbi:MAG TPA: hypothetical protein VJI67_00200 [archaeon]|nr:hypothetical protein [archaeon]